MTSSRQFIGFVAKKNASEGPRLLGGFRDVVVWYNAVLRKVSVMSVYVSSCFKKLHVDFDLDRLAAAAQADAFHRSHVGVVAAPCKCDVTVGDHQVIGGIKVHPAASRKEDGHPSMRSLGSLYFRSRAHIPADVACGQPL